MREKPDDELTDAEVIARREATLKRMLATPHKPHKPISRKRKAKSGRAKTKSV